MAILNQTITSKFAAYHGDCIEVMAELPDESVHLSIFSPPFADLYCYSDSERDLGNCENYEVFFEQFSFVVQNLRRLTKPGRVCCVHVMDIPAMKERDGYIGVKDFSGDTIRCFTDSGFIYHGRTTIWKDPLIEATRTKALGLMHKQLCKDSSLSRPGLPDYLLMFRTPGENETPVKHPDGLTSYAGKNRPTATDPVKFSHETWRSYASPVWMDIRQTRTIETKKARDPKDEKHICPLQLDVIERACTLWSNPGENVLTPFMGVGSEVYGAVINGRKGIGIELKESYYNQAVANLQSAVESGVESSLI